jgi:uncharacterized protein involved in cysteine biosynthesis
MLEILATIILLGLMLVPMVNVAVGAIAGFMLYGFMGALGGAFIGGFITHMHSAEFYWN